MHAENFFLHNCSQRNIVKHVGEHCPYVLVSILFYTLVIKSVDLSDSSGLMVSPK